MASPHAMKHLIVSNIVTCKSVVPLLAPTVSRGVLASGFIHINTNKSANSYLPIYSKPFCERDVFNRFPITRKINELLEMMNSSPSSYATQGIMLDFKWEKTPECDTFFKNLSGVKLEDVVISLRYNDFNTNNRGGDDFLFIKGEADEKLGVVWGSKVFSRGHSLPDRIYNYKIKEIKAEIDRKRGELKLTIPKLKTNGTCFELKPNVID